MRLPATCTLRRYPLTLLALLCAPAIAHAQPADDPALAEPPPPKPAPKPQPAPQPRTSTLSATPSYVSPPPPEVQESVETKEEWVEGTPGKPQGDLYDRVAAPTMSGPVGLLRTLTGDGGKPGTFRVGLHIAGFKQDSFLIAGNGTLAGDTNSRFTGDLTIGYTPWKYIEVYLAIFNASNRNERVDNGRTDPEVILSLGDLALGLKGRYPVMPFIDLALNIGIKLLNSVNGISFSGDSTNFTADLIASFDLRHAEATKNVPLRFHFNFGFLYDNSLSLLPTNQCAASTGNDPCIRSRVVETFAYGIGTNRLRMALAADAPGNIKGVGLEGFFEYHLEVGVGDGDQTLLKALSHDPNVSSDRLTSSTSQYLTLGLRVRPVAGLVLDAGIDVGLQSPGFQFGSPVVPWNVILGAAYAYDPTITNRTKLVTKTITREYKTGRPEGRIRGVVRDVKTKKVLAGATVKYLSSRLNAQLSGDDGTFLSYHLVPGTVTVEVSREDYEPMRIEAQIVANGETPVEALLTAKPPAAGQIRGHISDDAGLPVNGAVRFAPLNGGASVDADMESGGAFSAKLPGGEYTLEVTATGYLAKQRGVSITAGGVLTVDVVVHKAPSTSHVSVTKNEIAIKGTIHFGTNNAEIKPDGEQLLDEVVDVLIKNPQIKKVRIEGHTDNRGVADKNLALSKARAAAVMAYLIKQGIDPTRLESEGYGATQPLVPNLTPANRARNRRVTFKILEGGAP
jgi:outer membrane protein OmpA-like peptidoglycan-associated protein